MSVKLPTEGHISLKILRTAGTLVIPTLTDKGLTFKTSHPVRSRIHCHCQNVDVFRMNDRLLERGESGAQLPEFLVLASAVILLVPAHRRKRTFRNRPQDPIFGKPLAFIS